MRRTTRYLELLFMISLLCTLPLIETNAQAGISRRAMEELIEPEPIEQNTMVFQVSDATFPALEETDEPYTVEYHFTNRGKQPLTIHKVTVSCGCMAAKFDAKAVPTGGEGVISISFNPKGYSGNIYRQAFVYTSLSKEKPTARLTITGYVKPSKDPWHGYRYRLGTLRSRQNTVTFNVTNRAGKLAEVIACGNSGGKSLKLSAKGLPTYLKFRTHPAEIKPGEEADLIFLFDGSQLPADTPDTVTIPVEIEGAGETDGKSATIVTVIFRFKSN